MQLGLQDFGVQLKTVQMGPDVLASAAEFKPDIIFIDVLLQKKSGYEVAAELKSSQEFGSIPIVLMWSAFMEFSEDKAKATGAEGRLEKPFDSEILRNVTKDLVPRLKQHALSGFLSTPFISKPEATSVTQTQAAPTTPQAARPPSSPSPGVRATPTPAAKPVAPQPVPASGAPTPRPAAVPKSATPAAAIPKPTTPAATLTPRAIPAAPQIPKPPAAAPKPPVAAQEEAATWSMDDFPSPPVPGLDADAPTNPGISEEFTSQPLSPLEEQPIAIELDSNWKSEHTEHSSEPAEEWQKKELSNFTVNVPMNQLNGEVDVQINPNIDADIEFKTSVHQRFGTSSPAPASAGGHSQGAPKVHPYAEKELKAKQAREAAASSGSTNTKTNSAVTTSVPAISQDEMQRMIRSQTENLIKEMIQKIVPEMATQMIQAEIERLLSERGPTE